MRCALLRMLWIALPGILTCSSDGRSERRPIMDRPNVILFFLDDSGYGDFGFNGNPVIETPAIDQLAREGTHFTQFYVSTAACSASRYALLTGRYPQRSGLGSWVIGPSASRHLHTKELTLAEGLKSAGYKTGIFGKWHLGNPNDKNAMSADALPLAHGFDVWLGTNVSHDYGNAKLLKSDPHGNDPIQGYAQIADNLPTDERVCASLTSRYTKAAVEFIRSHKDEPFFAYIAHNQPHLGLYADEAFLGKSRRGLLGDVMAEVDHSVASVLKTVKEQGIEKNTLIIFSSDNGPWLRYRNTEKHAKYGEARLHVGYAWPFRDGKGCASWEGGFRVPGIFHWPGVIEMNRSLEPASTLDVLPTLFAICGVRVPANQAIDGRDIRGLLSPKLGKKPEGAFRFVYSYSDNKAAAYRRGPWKIHVRLGSQLGNVYGFKAIVESPLLFNVEEDLHERINRAAEKPDLVQELLGELKAHNEALEVAGTFWDEGKKLPLRHKPD